jgi:hypothetical protein
MDSVIKVNSGTTYFDGIGSNGWYGTTTMDQMSEYGNPNFVTGVMNESFYGGLAAGSAAVSGKFDGGYAGAVGEGAGIAVVTGGSNSGGCATSVAVGGTITSSGSITHTVSSYGFVVIIGLEGQAGTPPIITGNPYMTTGGNNYYMTFLGRHSNGQRTNELWWLRPNTPTGSPLAYDITFAVVEPVYYQVFVQEVGNMNIVNPLAGDAYSYGDGGTPTAEAYTTTITGTNPHNMVIDYMNGEIDTNFGALDHFCATGQFFVGADVNQAKPGETEPGATTGRAGTVSGIGASDWLHSAWEFKP